MKDLDYIRAANRTATRDAGLAYWRNEALTLRRLCRAMFASDFDTPEVEALREHLDRQNGA